MSWLTENASVLLNGVATGMILFLLAAGLTVVFGLLDVLNLAHGAVFLAGSYLGYSIAGETTSSWGGFGLALVAAAVIGGLAGLGLMILMRPLAKRGHLDQALLTLGLALVIGEVLLEIFGRDDHAVAAPPGLAGSVDLFGITYPVYRLVVIVVGAVLAGVMWFVLERTSAGAVVRATVADPQMVEAVGIDVRRVTTLTFALATAVAVVGGVLAGPVTGVSGGLDDEVLLLALVVIVVGGRGSIVGTLIGSLLIGLMSDVVSQDLSGRGPLVLGIVFVLAVYALPRGLAGLRRSRRTQGSAA